MQKMIKMPKFLFLSFFVFVSIFLIVILFLSSELLKDPCYALSLDKKDGILYNVLPANYCIPSSSLTIYGSLHEDNGNMQFTGSPRNSSEKISAILNISEQAAFDGMKGTMVPCIKNKNSHIVFENISVSGRLIKPDSQSIYRKNIILAERIMCLNHE
ncbi:hypothetical protein [Sphingomonas sp. MM-1]|uniref:hypothetical protein n=1 Tax=Sphingomonas sp. MM-1 TaxID=745310 RepID=UPI00118234D9|nr:hypothetical protein [Sphingomonas sp. MM-1]